jgi:hypothetical protein
MPQLSTSTVLLLASIIGLLLPHHAGATCVATSATCFHDSRAGRVLPYPNSHPRLPDGGAHLTRAGCMQLCDTAGYSVAGVEDGAQCFCGHSVPSWAKKAADSFCSAPCKGDAEETCGGDNALLALPFHCNGPPGPAPPPYPPQPPPPPPPPPPGPRPPFKPGDMNILFIGSDDMRAELGVYGSDHMHTPNLDRLGNSGTVFERGYIAVSVCMPSRTALLTSRRPDTTRNYELRGAVRKTRFWSHFNT